jgi:DNA-binding CsgD family transcriptional regulator
MIPERPPEGVSTGRLRAPGGVYQPGPRRLETQPELEERLQAAVALLRESQERLRRAAQHLRASWETARAARQQYRDVLDAAALPYLVTDARARIYRANRAAADMLAVRQAHLAGGPLSAFVMAKDRNAFESMLAGVADTGHTHSGWLTIKPWDGPPFPASIVVVWAPPALDEGSRLHWIARRGLQYETPEADLEGPEHALRLTLSPAPPDRYGLTSRERAVLALVAEGRSTKDVAAQLAISAFTVDQHISDAMKKMGAASRTQACVLAMREGLLG